MPTELLTPDEAAAWLKVKPRTLASWRHLGTGPTYVRQGRVVRYPADQLSAWLATHEVKASA